MLNEYTEGANYLYIQKREQKTANINSDKIVQLADTDTIGNLTSALSQRFIADQLRSTTAESCTDGKLASALCATEDTPKFYGVGFITFTDQAKMKVPSVSQQSLKRYSAVSEKVAAEMAAGAIERTGADVSIAITGYDESEDGEDGTPVGIVWFAWHTKSQTYTAVMHFAGDCGTVLALVVRFALAQLLQLLL